MIVLVLLFYCGGLLWMDQKEPVDGHHVRFHSWCSRNLLPCWNRDCIGNRGKDIFIAFRLAAFRLAAMTQF
jgi:hypothetical protein